KMGGLPKLHTLFASVFTLGSKAITYAIAEPSSRPSAIESPVATAINTVREYLKCLPKGLFQDT
ncbi:hypothetical protein, partial [Citrobacter braakii]|uniref:hypothetical protein n=1 Tax=Citrobacter braakii TaxID=57706 RepID=UPI001C6FC683